jgi:hypothetical protein
MRLGCVLYRRRRSGVAFSAEAALRRLLVAQIDLTARPRLPDRQPPRA